MPDAPAYRPSAILFGAAYYAEYHLEDRVTQDLDLMQEAGFTVIRVGESVWANWEPEDGRFELDWLQPVLDGAHERGIGVILGTATYAVPPWLQTAYPEIAAERRTGQRVPWGARQEVDYSHPAFLFHAERLIRKMVERYAQHPAVIGYQVDNEPGMELFHNHGSFTRFVRRLKQRYGDVETLNREWGLTYWSHRLGDWSELWRPDGNTLPQYDLAWRRYQAELTTEFISWQAAIVREYSRPDQFVTTCIAYPRPALDDEKLVHDLDITAGNPYYAMQGHLDLHEELAPVTPWTTSGVAGLFRQADRMYSSKQGRFLVTETDAQSIGGSEFNLPPYPGQLRQAAFAFVARGAAMVEYWHWHTLPYGTETYWGGVLPHSLEPGRVYRELSGVGADLRAIGTKLDGFEPDCDVALLWSNDSRYAFEFFPPLSDGTGPDRNSYTRIFDSFHRGVIEAGAQARILHVGQAHALGPAELAERYPVLVAPAFYVARDADLDLLREYAELGGHLMIGIRTGYGDEEARARIDRAPGRLHEAARVHYEEFSNLQRDVPVIGSPAFPTTGGAQARLWADGLLADGADVVATYEHPRFSDFAAITTTGHGRGRITVVGTVPSPTLAIDLVQWVVPEPVAARLIAARSSSVTVSSGTLPDGRRAWFLFNWGWNESTVSLAGAAVDAVTDERLPEGNELVLPSWGTRVLLDA